MARALDSFGIPIPKLISCSTLRKQGVKPFSQEEELFLDLELDQILLEVADCWSEHVERERVPLPKASIFRPHS